MSLVSWQIDDEITSLRMNDLVSQLASANLRMTWSSLVQEDGVGKDPGPVV